MSCGVGCRRGSRGSRLRSGLAVPAVWARSCGSDWTPSLEPSICSRCSPKKTEKKKNEVTAEVHTWLGGPMAPAGHSLPPLQAGRFPPERRQSGSRISDRNVLHSTPPLPRWAVCSRISRAHTSSTLKLAVEEAPGLLKCPGNL